ncbi:nuclear transport factor 2 family protein [Mycolicibacterium sp. XJ662]
MSTSEIATVLAWYDALNERDLDTLATLSSDDIEIGDADGAAQGHVALREWAQQKAGGRVETGRLYVHDGVVVAEELSGDSDAVASASAFRVVDDRVTSVFHHGDLASALAATELTEKDLKS